MLAGAAVIVVILVSIGCVTTEGGHFDDFTPEQDVDDPESAPDQSRVPKQLVDLLGGRVGGDVGRVIGAPDSLLIEAEPDVYERRRLLYKLTPKGEKLLKKITLQISMDNVLTV